MMPKPELTFTDRLKLSYQFYEWSKAHNEPKTPDNVITFLYVHQLIDAKAIKEYLEKEDRKRCQKSQLWKL